MGASSNPMAATLATRWSRATLDPSACQRPGAQSYISRPVDSEWALVQWGRELLWKWTMVVNAMDRELLWKWTMVVNAMDRELLWKWTMVVNAMDIDLLWKWTMVTDAME